MNEEPDKEPEIARPGSENEEPQIVIYLREKIKALESQAYKCANCGFDSAKHERLVKEAQQR